MTPPTPVIGPVSPLATQRLAVAPLGLDQVEVTGGFWAEWQRLNREVTAPHALGWLERDGSVENLRRLNGPDRTDAHRGLWFSDSDVYKVLDLIETLWADPHVDQVPHGSIEFAWSEEGVVDQVPVTGLTAMLLGRLQIPLTTEEET